VRIRLIRKLAAQLNGIDLSAHAVGDVFEAPRYEAELVIAEGWAVAVDEPRTSVVTREPVRHLTVTTTLLKLRTVEQLRRVREALAVKQLEEQARRRAEDRIRDELHDARAKTISAVTQL
jgi:hypothetical protein